MTSYELLKLLLEYQKQTSTQLYLVGGFIRDIILNKKSYDLDFTFKAPKEGIESLYELIHKMHEVVMCSEFQTMRFESSDHIHFDIATMRREIYNETLKKYEQAPSTLKWDISRRDFTVNTAYVKMDDMLCDLLINYLKEDNITEALIAYIKTHLYASHPLFLSDLNAGLIRVLHLNSFNEDASRILRAVKIKNHLNFKMENRTLEALLSAIESDQLLELSLSRLQIEFTKLFTVQQWRSNLETLISFNWREIILDDDQAIVCNPVNQSKRVVLMSRFEQHIEWLYGVDPHIKKCHEEYRATLEAFLLNSEINDYNLYKLLYNKRVETLVLIARRYKDKVILYENELKAYAIKLTGHDLIRIGVPQNYKMRVLMDALLEYKINHRIELSLEDEIKYIESLKYEY